MSDRLARLRRALEAEGLQSPNVAALLEGASPVASLLVALHCARNGDRKDARHHLDRAQAQSQSLPAVLELITGLLRFVVRDYQGSLDAFGRASTDPKARRRAWQEEMAAAGSLGWDQDVRRVLMQAIEREPDAAIWRAQAVRFYVQGRHHEAALEHARAGVELAPNAANLWMETAGLEARLRHPDRARTAIARALARAPEEDQVAFRREAARVAIDCGLWTEAETHHRWTIERAPNPESWVVLGDIAAWRGDSIEARDHAERALSLAPEHPSALRLLGALDASSGHFAAALPRLERAVELDPNDSEAHIWLAHAMLDKRQYRRADAHLRQATMSCGGYLFVAWMLRFLLAAREDPAQFAVISPNRTEEFEAVLVEVAGELGKRALESRTRADTVDAIELSLARMQTNRSIYATYLDDSGLHRLRARTGCRHASRWALQLVRVAAPETCFAELERLMDEYPQASLPVCHRGELHLWLGNYDQAKADLERAIAMVDGTRWAYIGLSTFGLLEGDPSASLAMNARGVAVMNSEGPAIYVYRGEAYRRLGQLDEACAELERADELHPARASAAINLALTYAAQDRWPEARELWLRLRDDQCPGLLSDAARELGIEIVGNRGFEAPDEAIVAVLERSLSMMGGNRSSGLITYKTADDRLRFVSKWPHGGAKPHDRDEQRLMQAEDLLLRAARIRR